MKCAYLQWELAEAALCEEVGNYRIATLIVKATLSDRNEAILFLRESFILVLPCSSTLIVASYLANTGNYFHTHKVNAAIIKKVRNLFSP